MSPHPRRRSAARRKRPAAALGSRALGLILALGLAFTGCAATFDPTGPCTANGSAPGAYPDLEAALPTSFRGAGPADLDSGRACTPDGLGTLAGHGVDEMRFAGATWTTATDSGLSLAVFVDPTGPSLTRDWIVEFYETGARAGKNVTSVETTDYSVGPAEARRIDVLNRESFQSVVVWEQDGRVAVALVADFIREIQTKEAHDAVVREAVDALGRLGARPA